MYFKIQNSIIKEYDLFSISFDICYLEISAISKQSKMFSDYAIHFYIYFYIKKFRDKNQRN